MNTSAGGLSAVGLAVVIGLSVNSCGGADGGEELDGASVESTAGETGPEDRPSDSEEPRGEGSETENPQPSPTPVPASSDGPAENWPKPEVPDQIYEETEEGALATLRYWFDAINYLQLTGDYGPVDEVSAPDCEMCNDTIAQYFDLYEVENGWYVARGARTQDELVSGVTDDGHASVLFTLVEGGYEAHGAEGQILGAAEEGSFGAEAFVYFDDNQWWLSKLQVAETGAG